MVRGALPWSVGGPAPPGRALLLGVLGAEAGARDLDEVGAVGEAVEGGRGEEGLAEKVWPFRPIAIAGQDDRRFLVAFVDDVVEVFGAGPAEGLQPEVVEDEQIGARVARETLLMGAVGAAAGEMREHLGGVNEEDIKAAAAGFMSESLAKVALADARRTVDQGVLVTLDELAGGEIEDLGLVEFGVEAEVEAFEGLGGIEGGPAQAQAELALGAALDFILQEHGEEFHEGGLLLDGLAIAHVEGLEDAGHAQGTQHGGELMSQFHGDRSSSAPGSGKKVVQGRACRGGAVATAAARGVKPGRG